MRHMTKKHTLGKAKDQRDALLRSLATELFVHGEIKTTMARAKALRPYAEEIITLAKLPSRQELLAKLAGALLGNITKLAVALDQVKDQKANA